jgi:hypothetical protein
MEDDRLTKKVYKASKRRMEDEESAMQRGENMMMTKTWCSYTRELMRELHLEEEWTTEQVPEEEEWNALIRERIHNREQIVWRIQCLLKPKLRTYSTLKKVLKPEPYLEVYHRSGISELAKVRGGTNRLRIEQGRYRKEKLEVRICEYCDSGRIEDEAHFMLECKLYEEFREEMWRAFEQVTRTSRADHNNVEEKLSALIGDKFQPETEEPDKDSPKAVTYREIAKLVMRFITRAMKKRREEKQ